ncbi:MAG: sugar ABC transporter permease [Anaerolineae bacterium]
MAETTMRRRWRMTRNQLFGRVAASTWLQEAVAGYLFVTPAMIFFVVFLLVPIIASIVLVFTEYSLLTPPRWIGLSNITRLLNDKRLFITYRNSLYITLGATALNNVLGLLLAMGVNRPMRGIARYLLRTAYFFPVLTTTASLAVVWRFILTQDRGILNYLLQQIGLPAVPWLSSVRWAIPSVILYDVWKSCGYLMVLYLAGLQGIPEVLYEAAKIDGANRWQLMRHITLPLITPTAFFCIVISLIGAFQIFDNAYVLTEGGPGDASRTIAMYIYEMAFKRYEMGYASAVALSLLLVLVAFTLFQIRMSRRWVHYE